MGNTALVILITILVLSVVFDFINGFHDTANAIATVVATRVLTPLQAILMAASLNFAGALTGTAVAKTISQGLIDPALATQQLIIAALIAAIIWNLITWYYGIPSSSSHALIGSIVGAAIAEKGSLDAPKWAALFEKVILPLIISPVVGFAFALVLMLLMLRLFIHRTPSEVHHLFGRLQVISSAFMAFSHGSNDAQKTMGVMTLAVITYEYQGVKHIPVPPGMLAKMPIPLWIMMTAATAMALGTAVGGWRVIKTMGHKLTRLTSIHGFAAETAAASVITVASHLGFPLSTTHVISSAILGVGASRRASAVRWNVAGSILTAWILTIPACMFVAGVVFRIIHLLMPG
ncbi:MAG: inorganic phosphate transporter [Abitibacteriaceae bacterium]|nr:inorganic phosphate transporter [Abditibacteriaceae bacterium]MBV9867922.1 inorganic phosphate transporter [Abditibacteriaceae bacterium]